MREISCDGTRLPEQRTSLDLWLRWLFLRVRGPWSKANLHVVHLTHPFAGDCVSYVYVMIPVLSGLHLLGLEPVHLLSSATLQIKKPEKEHELTVA